MKIFIFYIFLLVTLNAISVHHHAAGPMGVPIGGPMGGTMGEPTGNHVDDFMINQAPVFNLK